jgi:RimJ/RimL family protein N-acetyltransferase
MVCWNPEGHELGFHLLKAKWGRRYAFEVAQGVVRHGFEKLQLPVLRSGHHPDYVNSKNILLKADYSGVGPNWRSELLIFREQSCDVA